MACEECSEETLDAGETALLSALTGPAEASTDGTSVKQHNLADLIEADRYISAKCASRRPNRGLRITQLIPPGTV